MCSSCSDPQLCLKHLDISITGVFVYFEKGEINKAKCCVSDWYLMTAGQSAGASKQQVQHMYTQLSILQDMMGFVHRIGPEQLLKDLPAKHEHVVLVCLDTAQQRMYRAYLDVSHSLCLSVCQSMCLSVSVYVCVTLVHLFRFLVCLVCLSVCLSVSLLPPCLAGVALLAQLLLLPPPLPLPPLPSLSEWQSSPSTRFD